MRIKLLILIVFSLLIVMVVGCSHNSETMKSTEITIEKTDQVNRSKGLISPFDFDALQKNADVVVYGTISDILPSVETKPSTTDDPRISSTNLKFIHTDVVVDVKQTIKGQTEDQIVIRKRGGKIQANGESYVYVSETTPEYTVGEEVILFLKDFSNSPQIPEGFTPNQYYDVYVHGKWIKDQDDRFHPSTTKEFGLQLEELVQKISQRNSK